MFAKDYRALARHSLRGNWGTAIFLTFIAWLISGGWATTINSTRTLLEYSSSYEILPYSEVMAYLYSILLALASLLSLLTFVTFIIGGAVRLGLAQYNMHLVMRYPQRPFETLFGQFRFLLKALGLKIVIGFFTFLWSLLFIIPGIVASYRYSMAFYILAQNPDMSIFEAINRSKAMMVGNKWRLFCLRLSFIGWELLASIFTFGLGVFVILPYTNAAQAGFYLNLAGQLPYRRNEDGSIPGQASQDPNSAPSRPESDYQGP